MKSVIKSNLIKRLFCKHSYQTDDRKFFTYLKGAYMEGVCCKCGKEIDIKLSGNYWSTTL